MPPLSISVVVSPKGAVTARSWRSGAEKSADEQVDLTGLDGRVLRVFERWLMEQDRVLGQGGHPGLWPAPAPEAVSRSALALDRAAGREPW